jgi:hypothetical protein
MEKNEFRVRPAVRYIVTHFRDSGTTGGCSNIGTFDNIDVADRVGRALAASIPGATFATVEDRREPRAQFYAYSSEQANAIMEFIHGPSFPKA